MITGKRLHGQARGFAFKAARGIHNKGRLLRKWINLTRTMMRDMGLCIFVVDDRKKTKTESCESSFGTCLCLFSVFFSVFPLHLLVSYRCECSSVPNEDSRGEELRWGAKHCTHLINGESSWLALLSCD